MREPLLPTLPGANKTLLSKPAAAIGKTTAAASPPPLPPQSAALSTTSTAGSPAWIATQVRQHLPQSQPLTATLDRWVNQLNASTAPPNTPQQLVAAFVDRLVTAQDLTQPQRLSAAIQNSGIWLEAQLAEAIANPNQPHPALAQDLKGQLLSLAEQLRAAESTAAPTESAEAAEATPAEAGVMAEMAATIEIDAPAETETDTSSDDGDDSDDAELTLESDDDDRIDDDEDIEITLETGGESSAEGDSDTAADAETDAAEIPFDAAEDVEQVEADAPEPPSDSEVEPAPPPLTETTTRSAAHLARSKRTHSDQLIHDIDGMIKHVVTQQLHSLSSDSAQPRWLLELPFRMPNGAVLMLDAEIERERRGTRPEDERWNMRLKLNLPRIGPLAINLSLRLERLDAGLQAGTEAGAALIRDHLETLRQQFAKQHLDIASLYAGYRPQVHSTSLPTAPSAPMIREQG